MERTSSTAVDFSSNQKENIEEITNLRQWVIQSNDETYFSAVLPTVQT